MSAPSPGPQHNPSSSHEPMPSLTEQDRSIAVLAHLAALIAMVFTAGWLSFVGPLVIWFIYKDNNAFVRRASAESFNFNLSMWLMAIAGWICVLTLVLIPIGVLLLAVSFFGQIILHIIAAVKAHKGTNYQYPMQFLKVLS
ncbi:DUF4870 domain-containing protein [Austwickia chelonae]|uniref:DUF4870 domain-containing protein n=1 Tax=Austwickia chelonae TaxID=100225 RepID=UPI000E27E649|nr:DUF4870 domain-containing protein [Austwickia chelonae]